MNLKNQVISPVEIVDDKQINERIVSLIKVYDISPKIVCEVFPTVSPSQASKWIKQLKSGGGDKALNYLFYYWLESLVTVEQAMREHYNGIEEKVEKMELYGCI